MIPSSGWRQRSRASNPRRPPEVRSTSGWYSSVGSPFRISDSVSGRVLVSLAIVGSPSSPDRSVGPGPRPDVTTLRSRHSARPGPEFR